MISKDIARQTIDRLPNEATFDDIMYALYVQAKFEHGYNEIKDGKGVPQDEAKSRLQKWVK